MSSQSNTLYVVIDPSGAQSGANTVINSINAIINAAIQLNVQINNTVNNFGNLSGSRQQASLRGLRGVVATLQTDFGRLGAIVAAVQPVRMFHGFVEEIARVDQAYNGFMAMMNVTTNSLTESAEEFKYVAKMANAYGVQMEHLLKSYSKLRAASKDMMTKGETQKLFQSMTAVSSVLHAETYTVERMYNALIQMSSKGQIHMEELKQQLGEHLPGALAIAASAMKMKVGDMIKQMELGNIKARDLLVPLPDELMKRFGPAADIAAKSLTSQINRLKNIWFEMFATMSNNGISVGMANIVSAISSILDPSSKTLVEFSNIIGHAMTNVADFIRNLQPDDLRKFANTVIDVTKAVYEFAKLIIEAIKLIVRFSAEIALLGSAYVAYRVYVLGASASNVAFASTNAMVATSIGFVARAFGGFISLVAAGIAGYSLGTYLVNEFDIVKKGGIRLAQMFTELPIRIAGAWEELKIRIPLALGEAFELALTKMFQFFDYVKGFGDTFVGYLGLRDEKQERNFNFTSGLREELDVVVSTYSSKLSDVKRIYDELYNDVGKLKPDQGDLLARSGISQSALDEAKKYFDELSKLKVEAGQFADVTSGGKGKSAAMKVTEEFHKAVNAAKSFKDVYDIVVQDIKTSLEFGDLSPSQAFQRQIDELTKYSTLARMTLEDAINDSKTNAKEKAKLIGEMLKVDKDYAIELRVLQRDMAKELNEYLSQIEQAEIDSGSRRLDRLDQFIMDWRDKNGKLLERAQLENDSATIERLMRIYQAGKARAIYAPDEASGYSQSKASSDMVKDNIELFKGSERQLDAVVSKYEEHLRRLSELKDAGAIEDKERMQLQIQAETAMHQELFNVAVKSAQERLQLGTGTFADSIVSSFGRIAEGFTTMNAGLTDLMGDFFTTWTDGFAQSFGRAIVYAEDLNEALMNVAREALASLISGLVKLGIQWALNAAIGNTIQATAAATSAAITATQASAAATAWAPAAALASLATSGYNSIPAMAGMTAAAALSESIAASSNFAGMYDDGGHIPSGKWGIAGEFGPEIIQGPANVVSRTDTAKMLQYNNDLPESNSSLGDKITSAIQSAQQSQKPEVNLKTINVLDPNLLGSYLSTDDGERLIMNIVNRNSPTTS